MNYVVKNKKQQHIDQIFAKQKIKQIDFQKLKSLNSYVEFSSNNQTFNNSFNTLQKRKQNSRIQLSKCLGNLWSSQINEKSPIYKYDVLDESDSNNTHDTNVISDTQLFQRLRYAPCRDSDDLKLEDLDINSTI
ncbi:Hypothetical_protein [Hexamita inflata]|uniref:Hypothetical_protein n=1 Tax=Hexamita inflata TaxID=28002 RepID=A0AA86UPW7_9EUKA|nr:Hypothetical protein HINF_LOCUS51149 [Hexamita inflata]